MVGHTQTKEGTVTGTTTTIDTTKGMTSTEGTGVITKTTEDRTKVQSIFPIHLQTPLLPGRGK